MDGRFMDLFDEYAAYHWTAGTLLTPFLCEAIALEMSLSLLLGRGSLVRRMPQCVIGK